MHICIIMFITNHSLLLQNFVVVTTCDRHEINIYSYQKWSANSGLHVFNSENYLCRYLPWVGTVLFVRPTDKYNSPPSLDIFLRPARILTSFTDLVNIVLPFGHWLKTLLLSPLGNHSVTALFHLTSPRCA